MPFCELQLLINENSTALSAATVPSTMKRRQGRIRNKYLNRQNARINGRVARHLSELELHDLANSNLEVQQNRLRYINYRAKAQSTFLSAPCNYPSCPLRVGGQKFRKEATQRLVQLSQDIRVSKIVGIQPYRAWRRFVQDLECFLS